MTELTSHDHGERIGRLEGIIEQINERLGGITRHLDSLENQPPPRLSLAHRPSVGYLGHDSGFETIWWIAATSFETCRLQVVKDA